MCTAIKASGVKPRCCMRSHACYAAPHTQHADPSPDPATVACCPCSLLLLFPPAAAAGLHLLPTGNHASPIGRVQVLVHLVHLVSLLLDKRMLHQLCAGQQDKRAQGKGVHNNRTEVCSNSTKRETSTRMHAASQHGRQRHTESPDCPAAGQDSRMRAGPAHDPGADNGRLPTLPPPAAVASVYCSCFAGPACA